MKTLSKEQVLRLHNALLETFGGTAGVRDDGLLESALNAPFATFGGQYLYPSIQAKAAQLGSTYFDLFTKMAVLALVQPQRDNMTASAHIGGLGITPKVRLDIQTLCLPNTPPSAIHDTRSSPSETAFFKPSKVVTIRLYFCAKPICALVVAS